MGLCAFVLFLCACNRPAEPAAAPKPDAVTPTRIVSLAPSITEILFALGLGDRVVGVSTECRYPPEAAEKQVVGRFLAVGPEAIVTLEPDLVLVPPTTGDLAKQLGAVGVNCEMIQQFTVEETLSSIMRIGALCGAEGAAKTLADDIRDDLERLSAQSRDVQRPRVLIIVGRDYTASGLDQIYVAASNSFYGELVELAGGTSAYASDAFPYPLITVEGIMEINPDVVFDIVPHQDGRALNEADLLEAWQSLPEMAAVTNDRVYILGGDYIGIPGPRLVHIVEDMAGKLHPQLQSTEDKGQMGGL